MTAKRSLDSFDDDPQMPSVPVAPPAPVPPAYEYQPTAPADVYQYQTVAPQAPPPAYDTYADDDYGVDEQPEEDEEVSMGELFASGTRERSHGIRNALVVVLVLAVLGGLGYFGYTKGMDWLRSHKSPGVADYPGPGESDVEVSIPMGSGSSAMASILLSADVIASTQAFLNAVRADPTTYEKIQAGNYRLKTKMSAQQALEALADPSNRVKRSFRVQEGWTVKQMFDAMSKTTGVPLADLQALLADHAQLPLPSWAPAKSLEGFMFPNTYEYNDNPKALDLVKTTIVGFNQELASLKQDGLEFDVQAGELGITPLQLLTLASLIEKENPDPAYAHDIAQVFLNRIKIGMPLQSNATAIYACSLDPKCTKPSISINSPYNTYKAKAWPPGPICNPGDNALRAALEPTTGNYLYFVTVNLETGETRFASTAAGHTANVNLYHQWCSDHPGKCPPL